MEFQVNATVKPQDHSELDPLQRCGVGSLIDEQLELIADEHASVELLDHAVTVDPQGAAISLLIDVDESTADQGEQASRQLVRDAVDGTELLADWGIVECTTALTDGDGAMLGTAEFTGTTVGAEQDDDDELIDPAEHREQLLADAARLQAFGPEAFGWEPGHDGADSDTAITAEQAALVAGALMHGLEVLTDQLFADIETLRSAEATAADVPEMLVLDELPRRWAHRYDPLFAQQFLIVTAVLGHRLTQQGWAPPLCAAEAIALHVLKGKAADQLGIAGEQDLPIDAIFATFDQHAFEDTTHERLFANTEHQDEHVEQETPFAEWFLPYAHLTEALHPYLGTLDEYVE